MPALKIVMVIKTIGSSLRQCTSAQISPDYGIHGKLWHQNCQGPTKVQTLLHATIGYSHTSNNTLLA